MVGFWNEPQGAAVFKHQVIREYAPVFASKVGRWSQDHQVGIVDCYAGRGWYEDGTEASAAVALETARRLAGKRNVRCWFIESDVATYSQLADGVAASDASSSARVLCGTASEHLDLVLHEADNMPLFVFVDPYGLGLDFELLTRKLLQRTAKTEVLVNFVRAGLYRPGGKLDISSDSDIQHAAADTTVRRVNANLGGAWWHPVWRSTPDKIQAVEQIRDRYVERLLARAGDGWDTFGVPVADSLDGKPIYDLLLFTRHPHGPWCFNDAVSLARSVFTQHCDPDAFRLRPPLWDPDEDWVRDVERNLRRLLEPGRPVRLLSRIREVYGAQLGIARKTHVKKAIKQLHADGLISGPITGDPMKLTLVPAGAMRVRSA